MASLSTGWKVELQVGDPTSFVPGLYDTALYDTDVYGTSEPTAYLLDVTSRCLSLTTNRGRRTFTGRFRTGKVSLLLDNQDGGFTDGNPPVGALQLRPGRSIRVTYEGAAVFFGFVDTMDDRMGANGAVNLRIVGYDLFSSFNVNDRPAVAPEGGGELSEERYVRLLDRFTTAAYEYLRKALQPWTVTVQATAMGQNLLTELQITADSEGGGCWISPSGAVTVSQRDYFTDRALLDPDWVVGAASPIQIRSVTNERTMQRIITEAHLARVGGDEQIAINSAAFGLFGRRTHTRLDLICSTDQQVAELANRLVDFAGVDRKRLTGMVFVPEPGSDAAMMCVGADFGDVIRTTVDTLDGWASTTNTQLFGIAHDVDSERWVCTMFVDDSQFAPTTEAFDINAFDAGYS